MRAGSWNTFERRFKPISLADGSMMRDHAQLENADPRYVWTVVEAEGKSYCAAGYHIVNRLGYLLCAVQWQDADELRDYVY